MAEPSHPVLHFDCFAVDQKRGCLSVDGRDVALRPKTYEVLRYLAQHAGRLVPKQEIHDAVWPDVFVTDDSLVQCIRELRETLGDDGHRVIKTVSGADTCSTPSSLYRPRIRTKNDCES